MCFSCCDTALYSYDSATAHFQATNALPQQGFQSGRRFSGLDCGSTVLTKRKKKRVLSSLIAYTLTDLTTDRAAGERMVEAIRTQQLFTSLDKLLNPALEHVCAAVHQGHPKEDWLAWLCDILVDIPWSR